jgi:hypothetical protein
MPLKTQTEKKGSLRLYYYTEKTQAEKRKRPSAIPLCPKAWAEKRKSYESY